MEFGRESMAIRCVPVLALFAAATICAADLCQPPGPSDTSYLNKDHVAWVADVLNRMNTIKPGMTRETLLTVFTAEGGLSTPLKHTYASRDCPYFKVDVEFRIEGRPERDGDGRITSEERAEDVIARISRPYRDFTIAD
jgi:hypothetical protein